MKRRAISMLLVLLMIFSLLPVSAFAADEEEIIAEEPAAEEVLIEEAPVEEIPAEEIPAEEIPTEEPAEEIPAEEPAEESAEEPAEEPAEEIPAEEPAEELAEEAEGDAELLASYYYVVFKANGGTGTMAKEQFKVGVAKKLDSCEFTCKGYTFAEWNEAADGSGASYTKNELVTDIASAGETLTLYAIWAPNAYEVRFVANGGDGSATHQSFDYGVEDALDANPFTRDGYTFKCWNTEPDGSGTSYNDGQTVKNLTAEEDGEIELFAIWTKNYYYLHFDGNGADNMGAMKDQKFTVDVAQAITKNTFTLKGYTFDGWMLDNGTPHDDGDIVTNPGLTDKQVNNGDYIDIHAQWRPNVFTIKYYANGGTGTMMDQTVEYDDGQTLYPMDFKREGYTFVKWTTKADGTGQVLADGDTIGPDFASKDGTVKTLYAQWEPNKYVIHFDGNGADNLASMDDLEVPYGKSVNLPAKSYELTGYKFAGWNNKADGTGNMDFSNKQSVKNLCDGVTETEITLYAQWAEKTYFVAFNANGGTGTMSKETFAYDTAKDLTPNAFTRTGYTFDHWNDAKDDNGNSYINKETVVQLSASDNSTVTLYAQWTPNQYSVTFLGNGSTSGSMSDQTFDYGTADILDANAFTRDGYAFNGWNTAADGSGKSYKDAVSVKNLTATKDGKVNLYAQWKAIAYTIVFDGNGATSGKMGTQKTAYNQSITLNAKKFQLTGYKFAGWNTAPDGSGVFYENQATVKNLIAAADLDPDPSVKNEITLYAQWEAKTYTIQLNGNSGGIIDDTMMPEIECTYDVSVTLPANEYERGGRTFQGWAIKSSGKVKYADGDTVENLSASDGAVVVLYAVWKENTYTVHFDGNGEDSGTMADQEFTWTKAKALAAKKFLKTGFLFDGWYCPETGEYYDNKQVVKNLADGVLVTDVTMIAQWVEKEYTVVFNANGGDNPDEMDSIKLRYTQAKDLPLNDFDRKGYTFTGWNTKANGAGDDYADGDNISSLTEKSGGTVTLYAQWVANEYTIVFVGNGEDSGTMDDMNMKYGKAKTLYSNAFKRDDYKFVGWNTDINGNGTAYANRASVKNLTDVDGEIVYLYAQWKEKT